MGGNPTFGPIPTSLLCLYPQPILVFKYENHHHPQPNFPKLIFIPTFEDEI